MREYSKTLRIWHWLFAFSMFLIAFTVILRKTFLNRETIAQIISDKVVEYGAILNSEQLKVISKAIRAPMWDWHMIIGYFIAFLIVVRIIMIVKNGFEYSKKEDFHMKIVHVGYKLFYIVFFVSAFSGVLFYNYEFFGFSKEFTGSIKELHEILSWAALAFIPLHIFGVIISEFKEQKGIVSKIISN